MTPWSLHSARRGITLIELLLVIFIMLLITAIAIPTMSPSIEQRRIRETSRLVTSYIQGARTRAIQIGRPVGVWIEEMPSLDGASTTMFYGAVPPIYAGDSVGSTVTISVSGSTYTAAGTFDTSLVQV